MRKRTRISRSKGSMWMSLARLLDGVLEQRVHQPDDRRVVGGLEQILRFVRADLGGERVEIFGGVERERFGGGGAAIVDVVDGIEDRAAAREFRLDLGAVEEQAQIVDGVGVEGIGDGDVQDAGGGALERQDAVRLGECDRDPVDEFGVDAVRGDRAAHRHVERLAERAEDLLFFQHAVLDQHVDERVSGVSGARARVVELLGREAGRAQQQRAQRERAGGRDGSRARHGVASSGFCTSTCGASACARRSESAVRSASSRFAYGPMRSSSSTRPLERDETSVPS